MEMVEILRLIAGRSSAAATEAMRAIRAPEASRQSRYNLVAELALSDPQAAWTSEERVKIASLIAALEERKTSALPATRVTPDEMALVVDAAHRAGMSTSAFIRAVVLTESRSGNIHNPPDSGVFLAWTTLNSVIMPAINDLAVMLADHGYSIEINFSAQDGWLSLRQAPLSE